MTARGALRISTPLVAAILALAACRPDVSEAPSSEPDITGQAAPQLCDAWPRVLDARKDPEAAAAALRDVSAVSGEPDAVLALADQVESHSEVNVSLVPEASTAEVAAVRQDILQVFPDAVIEPETAEQAMRRVQLRFAGDPETAAWLEGIELGANLVVSLDASEAGSARLELSKRLRRVIIVEIIAEVPPIFRQDVEAFFGTRCPPIWIFRDGQLKQIDDEGRATL